MDPSLITQKTTRLYRPIDVASYGDALRVTSGWLLVALFAVISGTLFALYEVILEHLSPHMTWACHAC